MGTAGDDSRPTLIVITGPTGSGKTALAIEVAERLGCDIVSADSRQIYKGIPIGTAAPTPDELARVRHHFIAELELDAYYSAALYEEQALERLRRLWMAGPDVAVMCGGSMMYVDAVTRGIDTLPTISERVRAEVLDLYREQGLAGVSAELLRLDPESYKRVDLKNYRRVIHAVEICRESGRRYSELCTGRIAERPFRVLKFAIERPREEMMARINTRVDAMMAAGLEEEARRVYHMRHLNSLNTVGYKEMFAWFDGIMDRETAVARMAKNTRVYAKKQLTWLKRDPELQWLAPEGAAEKILLTLNENK